MALMDKLKKGLDVATKNAKTAGNVAMLKKDLESAKFEKGKKFKEIGEIAYKHKDELQELENLSELFNMIEELDNKIEDLTLKIDEEKTNFGK